MSSISKTKTGKCLWLARSGFLLLVLSFCRCFHLNIALLVLFFFVCMKNQNEQQKAKKVQMETRLKNDHEYLQRRWIVLQKH